jgi:hypothetical protein
MAKILLAGTIASLLVCSAALLKAEESEKPLTNEDVAEMVTKPDCRGHDHFGDPVGGPKGIFEVRYASGCADRTQESGGGRENSKCRVVVPAIRLGARTQEHRNQRCSRPSSPACNESDREHKPKMPTGYSLLATGPY